MPGVVDDLGAAVPDGPWRRVVSLVPSITETVALTLPGALVGATDYCVRPAGLDVARVGGSKYPSIDAIVALRPDLVLANVEENRRDDADALRAAGIPVWTTAAAATVPAALASLRTLLAALGAAPPEWLTRAEATWAVVPAVRATAVTCVWRRPWIVLGRDTFAGDVLRRLGVANVFAASAERYPRPPLAELRAAGADVVVLPDEPYAFSPSDGPEAFPGAPCALVDGRALTWWGPSLVDAHAILSAQLDAALGVDRT